MLTHGIIKISMKRGPSKLDSRFYYPFATKAQSKDGTTWGLLLKQVGTRESA